MSSTHTGRTKLPSDPSYYIEPTVYNCTCYVWGTSIVWYIDTSIVYIWDTSIGCKAKPDQHLVPIAVRIV